MREQTHALSSVLILLLTCILAGCRPNPDSERPWTGATILISLDGFRWDYRSTAQTPVLDMLAERGAMAERLIPATPAKTFPNHHSIATGLYPDKHGVVGNTMYDPEFEQRFSMSDRDAVSNGRWWGGEPIWVTAKKASLIVATFFWPATDAEIDGIRPDYWRSYDSSVDPEARVDQILEWLDLPLGRRPHFLTLYFSDVDGAGHRYGPGSSETVRAVEAVDAYLGRLVQGLASRELTDLVNLVVVSDHGMMQLSPDSLVFLDDYINVESANPLSFGQYLSLWPDASDVSTVYSALRSAHPALAVYRSEEIPERYHLKGHRRTPPIIGFAKPHWSITTREYFTDRPTAFDGGGHGYDPAAKEMSGIFIMSGPRINPDVLLDSLSVVDVYNVLADLLGILPSDNEGDESVLPLLLTGIAPADSAPSTVTEP